MVRCEWTRFPNLLIARFQTGRPTKFTDCALPIGKSAIQQVWKPGLENLRYDSHGALGSTWCVCDRTLEVWLFCGAFQRVSAWRNT